MFPQGVITGRVLDEDGDPIQARIQVFALMWSHGKQRLRPRGAAMSSDLGEYRVPNLPPGKYFLSAESRFGIGRSELPAIPGQADIRQVRTFFPDATSIDQAAPISVQVGQTLTGMDIRLRMLPTYHVRGAITGALSRTNLQGLGVSISPRDSELMFFFGGANVTKKGTFDLGSVPNGSYKLTVYQETGDFHVVGNTPVEVSGSDVNDAVINVVSAGLLRGRIQIEGAPRDNGDSVNIGSVRLHLQSAGGTGYGSGPTPVKQDGSFTIEEIDPGKYDLGMWPTPDGTYIKSVQLGQQEMLGKELDFTQGVSGELLITLSYGVAEVDGIVQMPSQQDSAGSASSNQAATAASIVLVPEELRPDGSGFEYGNTTQTGTFTIKNVAPGRYRAYAFEELKRDQMDNPDFVKQIESKGVEVELKENDKKQVQLTLIPSADTQKILAQLGIEGQ
jgi:hypothetical protein